MWISSVFKRCRVQTYNVLHNDNYRSTINSIINILLVLLIIGNVAAVVLESDNDVLEHHLFAFKWFELISIAIFSVEYILRFWSIAEQDESKSAFALRWQWVKSGGAIIDLLAILPAYLGSLVTVDLRILRVLRLFRLLKLTRYFASMQILMKVIRKERGSFQAVIFILVIMIVITSSGIYALESQVQPEEFGSIPKAMWWSVVTLTTVGYGDVTPITSVGKVLGALITILGVGIAALPAGILASGLASELTEKADQQEEEFLALLENNAEQIQNNKALFSKLRHQVGLNLEQAQKLYLQFEQQQALEAEHSKSIQCPHCGGKVHI